jgi:DNA polymerase-3 subunit epsilon
VTAWWSGRAVLLDFESDSPDPTDARIITACVAYISPGSQAEVDTWLLKPERDIAAEATAIHGITTEHAAAHGQDRELTIEETARALNLIHSGATREEWGDVPVIGHNVKYDLTLLDRELRRTGVGSLGTERDTVTVRIDGRTVGAFRVIDSMVLDKRVDPFRPRVLDERGDKMPGNRRLSRVAEVYGVPIRGDAHTAEADALAAGRVVWAIARRCAMANGETAGGGYDMQLQQDVMDMYADRKHPNEIGLAFAELARMTLPQLHRAQTRWAAEQADDLRGYFSKNPDQGDPAGVTGDWPLQPVGTVDVVTGLV